MELFPSSTQRFSLKECKDIAFHSRNSVTDRRDNETWVDQNDDGDTKSVMEFIKRGLNGLTVHS
jgi:hypothetical protein